MDKGTAIDVYQWFCEVCSTKLLQTPIILGGTVIDYGTMSTVVQIDESLFCHKPKVSVGNQMEYMYVLRKLYTQ